MRQPLIKHDDDDRVIVDPKRLYIAWKSWRLGTQKNGRKLTRTDWNYGFAQTIARRLNEPWQDLKYLRKHIEIPLSRSDLYRLKDSSELMNLRRDVAIQIYFLTEQLDVDFDGDVSPNGSIGTHVINSSNLVTLGRCIAQSIEDDDAAMSVAIENIHFPSSEPMRVTDFDTRPDSSEKSANPEVGIAYFGLTEALVSIEGCNPLGNQLVRISDGESTPQGSVDKGLEIDLAARISEVAWRITSAGKESKSGREFSGLGPRVLNGWLKGLRLVDVKSDITDGATVKVSAGYLHLGFELHFDDEHTPKPDEKRNTRKKLQEQIFRTRMRDKLDQSRFVICIGFLQNEGH